MEQLVSDLRAKREQLRILQDNVNFLEEKQAQFGFDVPCKHHHHDGRVVDERRADLSRDDLIAASRALHWKEQK